MRYAGLLLAALVLVSCDTNSSSGVNGAYTLVANHQNTSYTMNLDLSTSGTDVSGEGTLELGAATAARALKSHNDSDVSVTGTHTPPSLTLEITVQSNSDLYEFDGTAQSGPSSFRGDLRFPEGFSKEVTLRRD